MLHTILFAVVFALTWPEDAAAQPDAAVLEIDTANVVIYRHDVFDATRVATDSAPTSPLPLRTFMHVTWIGDVVAVNGTAARGTLTIRGTFVTVNPTPGPGTGIGDISNTLASDFIFDIQREDGTPVGTIMASGWAFGARVAGMPAPGQGNFAVLGGTGAFVGVRGQGKETSVAMGAQSFASITEDPSIRRIRGGRSTRYTLHLLPLERPEFVRSPGLNVFHSDFSPVTSTSPARRDEVLIAAVTGLGPTLPGKEPGSLFSSDTLQPVVAPVQVLVNGIAVNSVNQIGWPGTTGTYRVDFRVPANISPGMAAVQLASAWIPGPAIRIPVQ